VEEGVVMLIDGIPAAMTRIQVDAFDSLIDYFRVTAFIELGTFKGGLACHFVNRQKRTKKVRRYDREFKYYGFECDREVIDPRMLPHITIADVTHLETIDTIRNLVNSSIGPVIIFCDTNNKPREMLTYGKLLRVLDIVIGHDYPGEITDEFLNKYGREHPNLQEIGGPVYRSQGYSAWIRIR